MASLNIRNLPVEAHARLRVRAAKAGHSMEAEAREILAAAVHEQAPRPFDPVRLQRFVAELFHGRPPKDMTEKLIAERGREAEQEERGAGGTGRR